MLFPAAAPEAGASKSRGERSRRASSVVKSSHPTCGEGRLDQTRSDHASLSPNSTAPGDAPEEARR